MTENITELPVKFKRPIDETGFLKRVRDYKCIHGPFLIDDKKMEVECEKCHERLNPMAVLMMLANHETRWHDLHERYQEETKRLSERSRTKCNNCGVMTKISRA